MSYATGTTHYNLPQTAGTDKRDWSDTNQAFADVDAALYQASQDASTAIADAATAQTTANTAVTNAAAAQSSADDATASAATAGELAQHVSVELGTLANLTTTDKTSAVAAINEVNGKIAKGEISVTADGVKTYTQLLNELYALVDRSKLSGNSYFTGAYGIVARCNGIQTSYIGFNSADVEQTALKSTSFGLKPSDSFVYSFNGTTVTNNSSNVVTSGTVLKVVY